MIINFSEELRKKKLDGGKQNLGGGGGSQGSHSLYETLYSMSILTSQSSIFITRKITQTYTHTAQHKHTHGTT